MSRQRQVFPYFRGTSIYVRPETLNLLAQVKLPGETWTGEIERVVRQWARDHGVELYDQPAESQVFTARYAVLMASRTQEEAPHG